MKRKFFTFLGFIFLALGIIGAFLPIVPTVPFILVAAYFFERGSDRFYEWLLNNKYFGEHLKDYRINKGITKKNKIIGIVSTIFGMTLGMFFMPFIIGKIFLFFILVGVIFHIIRVDTIKK
ncbi:YbaN family protein [Cetobacterium somerae]|uniref:YbaN family protein n=1 Tax=Cetobacterium sp. NK01 TaxID=2993530 RepID=UPI002115EEE8|nr:YbaN family protein [Cetobacterium sp. NK01]MCQ8212219.1 YbaN family protein [Cetobacterium sp. NK01]